MEVLPERDGDQAALWNGPSGQAWVEAQEALDQMFEPFQKLLVEAVSAGTRQVLDVGCGTGATTLAVARRVGTKGDCAGMDISAPMIAAARARAEREGSPARFRCADAQVYAFEPAGLDLILSRFGVMFFDDPVRAFGNLRRAARDGASLRFIAWRSPAENPFMTTAERAAAPLLPDLPARRSDAPGQFAFANRERVRDILERSGWTGIDIAPIDVECRLPAKELDGYLTRLGPVGSVLRETDEPTRARVVEAVRPAFDRFVQGDEVRFTAACWTVGART